MTIATAAGRTLQCLLDDEIEPSFNSFAPLVMPMKACTGSGPSRENLHSGHSNT